MHADTPTRHSADALRAAIDRGETGDKLPYSDPAALGADGEAAGWAPSSASFDVAFAGEMRPPVRYAPGHGRWAPVAVAVAAVVAAVAIVLVAATA